MGEFIGSTFPPASSLFHDAAWVSTISGWIPEPKINGYSAGTLNVPAAWAGISPAPIGSTVCRYGLASGGPHCGTINQLNFNYDVGGIGFTSYVINTTRVAGSCTDFGDSGGPFIAASSGQLQGTNIGSLNPNTCPSPTDYVHFQPFQIHLTYWTDRRILTTHGAAAPTVPGVICPNMGSSGSGMYMCEFGHYNSQGTTTVSWTSSTSDTSSGPKLWGSCTPGYPVNVWLTITNPYGSYNYSKTFTCPTTIIP